MKSIISLFALITFTSVSAFAQTQEFNGAACFKKAEEAVAVFAADYGYDEGGFFTYECELAENRKAVLCGVGANKGDGAAVDSYLVVLNLKCDYVHRVEMTGEE